MRWVAICIGLVLTAPVFAAASAVEFNRDIRPLLSDRCYTCHGPDKSRRTSKLRLDSEESAKGDLGGRSAIVPGSPDRSELVRRITSDDKARRMPPAWAGANKLSGREIELLTRWIAEGAKWQKHWSFIPPVRQEPPAGGSPDVRHPIDRFVRARLEREGLQPSAEADRRTLIRRVSLDLTGLPPTSAEVHAFVDDSGPDAYERLVDGLLASPHYGERMAARWLDAARYADTNGYQTDGERFMWRWRDWVIDAFNRNMPFDRFTVEQIAGDMLPNATRSQIIATGFNRNHRGNGEGGIIPEEYAVEYVADRVETTSNVWLGLTLGCARCHDHKYDPFTQKEFYQVFAYFNNVPERGKAFKYGNSPPVIAAPTREQDAALQALDRRVQDAERQLAGLEPEIMRAQGDWEQKLTPEADWAPTRSLTVKLPLTGTLEGLLRPEPPRQEKYLYLMENPPTSAAPAPVLSTVPVWKDGAGEYAAGRRGQAAAFDGKRYVEVGNVANFGFYDSFTLAAWIYPTAADGVIVSRAQDEPEGQGYGLSLRKGKLYASMVQRWLDDGGRVQSVAAVPLNQWSHVMLTYDGTRLASGIRLYLNGQPLETQVELDDLNQTFDVKQPLRVGGGLGPANRFRGLIADVRAYSAALDPDTAAVLSLPQSLPELAAIAPPKRSRAESGKLRRCFLEQHDGEPAGQTWARLLQLREDREKMVRSFPTVMVMQESATPRATHVLLRGAYDRPGDVVQPGVPAALFPLPAGAPNNRLGFAQWLVDPRNPLTARVIVNRFWQMYFGTGLVKTPEDFGAQGEWPSHPELLDWLATEFVRTGWDVKAMQKLIVTSATYKQTSRVTPALLERDPENRLLARGPRVRLSAAMVRDQALAVSGLLVDKVGGPSVKPYQPPGLWKELQGGEDYRPDTGEGLHRRSMYTFWKRTAPPPMMMNFDAAGRETCVVREVRTNTPLQSLDLMNDPIFLEAARALAGRILRDGGTNAADRIAYGFELATARMPKPREAEILRSSLQYYLDRFQGDRDSAVRYLGGASAENPAELAAWSTVASMILNLDVMVTKE